MNDQPTSLDTTVIGEVLERMRPVASSLRALFGQHDLAWHRQHLVDLLGVFHMGQRVEGTAPGYAEDFTIEHFPDLHQACFEQEVDTAVHAVTQAFAHNGVPFISRRDATALAVLLAGTQVQVQRMFPMRYQDLAIGDLIDGYPHVPYRVTRTRDRPNEKIEVIAEPASPPGTAAPAGPVRELRVTEYGEDRVSPAGLATRLVTDLRASLAWTDGDG